MKHSDTPIGAFVDNLVEKIKTGPLKVQDSALRSERKKLTGQRDEIDAAMKPLSQKMSVETEACIEEVKALGNPDRALPALLAPLVEGDNFPPAKIGPEYLHAVIRWVVAAHLGDHRRKFLLAQLKQMQKEKDSVNSRLVEIDRELAVIRGKLLE